VLRLLFFKARVNNASMPTPAAFSMHHGSCSEVVHRFDDVRPVGALQILAAAVCCDVTRQGSAK
jgi:hypothetical protein